MLPSDQTPPPREGFFVTCICLLKWIQPPPPEGVATVSDRRSRVLTGRDEFGKCCWIRALKTRVLIDASGRHILSLTCAKKMPKNSRLMQLGLSKSSRTPSWTLVRQCFCGHEVVGSFDTDAHIDLICPIWQLNLLPKLLTNWRTQLWWVAPDKRKRPERLQ